MNMPTLLFVVALTPLVSEWNVMELSCGDGLMAEEELERLDARKSSLGFLWFRDLDTLNDWIAEHNLVIHNVGSPTFRRNDSMSYIDLTLTTEDIAGKVVKWKVLEEENLSDHAYISFELKNDTVMSPALTIKNMGWCLNNVEGFIDKRINDC
ncbi:hypothetical protein J6590_076433 [Homalodisca vitripennis]|nr:hypothetical protein J6590_076433 [Homalodisca vitripennis]